MAWNEFSAWLLCAVLGGCGTAVAYILWRINESMVALNEKVAVVISNSTHHEERLDRHEEVLDEHGKELGRHSVELMRLSSGSPKRINKA